MFLAVDIGNSLIKFGVYRKRRLKELKFIRTCDFKKNPSIPDISEKNIEKIGIASVVPEVNDKIKEILKKRYKITPEIITYKNCKFPVKLKNPERTGIDRILNCKAGYFLFGSPLIVVDMGTAVTIDFVSEKGEFAGGIIIPGPKLWLSSLTETSLRTEVDFGMKTGLIGKDTEKSITSGLKYGLSSAINGIVKIMMERYSVSKVVLTGGWADKFRKNMDFPFFYKPNLTIYGISLFLNGI